MEIGDVVVRKGYSTFMTVEEIRDEEIDCTWYEGTADVGWGQHKKATFKKNELREFVSSS